MLANAKFVQTSNFITNLVKTALKVSNRKRKTYISTYLIYDLKVNRCYFSLWKINLIQSLVAYNIKNGEKLLLGWDDDYYNVQSYLCIWSSSKILKIKDIFSIWVEKKVFWYAAWYHDITSMVSLYQRTTSVEAQSQW